MLNIKNVLVLVVAYACCFSAFAQTKDIGIVLMHGKGGNPEKLIAGLANELSRKGYVVSTPVMPWSGMRMYDASVESALIEIDQAVEQLRQKGAKHIIIAGHSMGANAAIAYAAARSVDGIIMLAPGHSPERSQKFFRESVKHAKELIASGHANEKMRFTDMNQGETFPVIATPMVYLSWFDPEGMAVMPKNAAAIKSPIPILVIVGSHERFAGARDYIFDKAPSHLKSKYLTVPADHPGVPSASANEVVNWLESLN